MNLRRDRSSSIGAPRQTLESRMTCNYRGSYNLAFLHSVREGVVVHTYFTESLLIFSVADVKILSLVTKHRKYKLWVEIFYTLQLMTIYVNKGYHYLPSKVP